MYARVLTRQTKPGAMKEAIAEYRNNVLPAANEHSGFKGLLALANQGTGKFVSITLWETEHDMMAGERSQYLQQQIDRMAPYVSGAPITEHFELVVATPVK
ncbi:MAG: hypothetical protein M1401_07785 [Chloroflexi bacterium]|nr:hypothetical protein [Chloroflexota bacterium]